MEDNRKWRIVVVFCFFLTFTVTSGSQEIMTKLAIGFSKVMDQCKTELNIQDNVIQEFANFWKEDYALVNRELGCMILCMAKKHDLITDDFKMHHVNAHDFAKTHGADDDTAKRLIEILHECEKSKDNILDSCEKTLEISKCFRTKIHELKWAPDMETVMVELLSDV